MAGHACHGPDHRQSPNGDLARSLYHRPRIVGRKAIRWQTLESQELIFVNDSAKRDRRSVSDAFASATWPTALMTERSIDTAGKPQCLTRQWARASSYAPAATDWLAYPRVSLIEENKTKQSRSPGKFSFHLSRNFRSIFFVLECIFRGDPKRESESKATKFRKPDLSSFNISNCTRFGFWIFNQSITPK